MEILGEITLQGAIKNEIKKGKYREDIAHSKKEHFFSSITNNASNLGK